MEKLLQDECAVWTISGCCCIGFLLMLILVPMSFASIAEHELGFLKHGISNKVKFDRMYEPGHHNTGPAYTFEKVNRHVHAAQVIGSAAWTCPEDDFGHCETNTSANTVGITVETDFTVMYRIIQNLEMVQHAYETYQFDDGLVAGAVGNLAKENSKATPQQYTLQNIIDSVTDQNNTQSIITESGLDSDIAGFGYELYDVLITKLEIESAAADKFLTTEIRRYEDDIAQKTEEAAEVDRETEKLVVAIQNEAIKVVSAITATAGATLLELAADLEAHRRQINIDATSVLIDMYNRRFSQATYGDIMEMVAITKYMDEVEQMGAQSGTDKIFMDHETNRLFTDEL